MQLLGSQGFRQHQVLRGAGGWGSRKQCPRRAWQPVLASRLQYSCLENPLPDREAWQATVHRDGAKNRTGPQRPCARGYKTFLACGSPAPARVEREGGAAAWLAGTLWHHVCRDADCLCCRTYDALGAFSQASCSWRSDGPFGQSFSIALPVQALRGLPCLGSFSVVWRVKHTEGPPAVDRRVRHLKGHPGWGPAL